MMQQWTARPSEATLSEWPWLRDHLGSEALTGLRVLDLGCGPGELLVELAQAGAEVTGVDLVDRHVEAARRRLESHRLNGTVLLADAEQLPFPEGSFDLVISNNALQFTPDLRQALRECERVLCASGELRVVVYHRGSAYLWWYFFLIQGLIRGELARIRSIDGIVARHIPWSTGDDNLTARTLTRRGLRRLLAEAGFDDVSAFARGFSWHHLTGLGPLLGRLPGLRGSGANQALGHAVGWYLVGHGRKPGSP